MGSYLDAFTMKGKVSIVTGGGRGIGLGIARALAGAGSDLLLVSRTEAQLAAAAADIVQDFGCRVEIIAAVLMLCGAAIGAQIGVTAVKYIRGYGIRLLFAIMIILAGSSVALKQFNLTTAASWVVMCAALGMCLVIMVKLWNGFKKEQAEKAAYAGKGGA